MNTPSSTPLAEPIVREAEYEAINRVAARRGLVEHIEEQQRTVVMEILSTKLQQADEATLNEMPSFEELSEQLGRDARERRKRFASVPDAQVGILPPGVAGVEEDSDRNIVISDRLTSAEADPEVVEEVLAHEKRHREQSIVPEDTGVVQTDDNEVNAMLALGTKEYREEDAMYAAGDKHTARSYHEEFKEPVNRIANYLNAHGEPGNEFVRNAGLRGHIPEVRAALLRAHLRDQFATEFQKR